MDTTVRDNRQEPPGTSSPTGDRLLGVLYQLGTVSIGALCLLALTWVIIRDGQAGPVGLWLKYNYVTAPGLIAGLAYGLWRYGKSCGAALLILSLLMAFLLILMGAWQTGESNYYYIGGLLPFSDAQGYYNDALRLLHGWRFSEFSSRRPLFPAFLAVLLALTGLSLPLTLIVITCISVLAVGFAVHEAQRRLGTAAGILMLLCLFMFYRRYIGSTLTEHLGLTWGCLAFCFLWRGAALHRPTPLVVGLFLLTLGLSARAGAFLVIPAIILWAGVRFRGPNRRGLKVAGAALAAALLGFAASAVLLRGVGTPGVGFSNFSYTLYGLVFGGNWTLALRQHPELAMFSELERTSRVYTLAWDGIRANPLALVYGALRAWKAFLFGGPAAWTSFIQYDVWPTGVVLPWTTHQEVSQVAPALDKLWTHLNAAGQQLWGIALQATALGGVVVLWRNRQSALATLTAAAWLGIFLSVPFAPPWDADNMRAYATTIPLLCTLPVLGVRLLRREPMERWGQGAQDSPRMVVPVATFCVFLLAAQFLGPGGILVFGWRSNPRGQELCAVRCDDGRQGYVLDYDPRSAVHLVEPTLTTETVQPWNRLALRDFRTRSLARVYPELRPMWRGLLNLGPNTTLALAFDHRRGGLVYLQGVTSAFPPSRGMARFCGEVIQSPPLEWVTVGGSARC